MVEFRLPRKGMINQTLRAAWVEKSWRLVKSETVSAHDIWELIPKSTRGIGLTEYSKTLPKVASNIRRLASHDADSCLPAITDDTPPIVTTGVVSAVLLTTAYLIYWLICRWTKP